MNFTGKQLYYFEEIHDRDDGFKIRNVNGQREQQWKLSCDLVAES